jgi:hypothetical protein
MGRARARALRLDADPRAARALREHAAGARTLSVPALCPTPRRERAAGGVGLAARAASLAARVVGSAALEVLAAGPAALEMLAAGSAALEMLAALGSALEVLVAGAAAYAPPPGGLRAAYSPPLQGGLAAHQVRSPV